MTHVMMVTNLFPQKRHRRVARSNSPTIQLRAACGSNLSDGAASVEDGGKRALRVQPRHVRTFGVDSMKDVIEQRAAKKGQRGGLA
jgi:hypothetical protein